MLRVNLTGTFFTCRAALRHLKEGARVVNVGSVLSLFGVADSAAYVAARSLPTLGPCQRTIKVTSRTEAGTYSREIAVSGGITIGGIPSRGSAPFRQVPKTRSAVAKMLSGITSPATISAALFGT